MLTDSRSGLSAYQRHSLTLSLTGSARCVYCPSDENRLGRVGLVGNLCFATLQIVIMNPDRAKVCGVELGTNVLRIVLELGKL